MRTSRTHAVAPLPRRFGSSILSIIASMVWIAAAEAQTNPAPQTLPLVQNWGTVNFNSLAAFPGFSGWNGVSGAATTTQALAEASAPTGDAAITSGAPTATGGLYGNGVSAPGNARLSDVTSSSTSNGVNQLAVALNTTGQTNITLAYDMINQIANTRTVGVVTQFRIGTSGAWTTIAGAGNPYVQSGGTVGTVTSVSLNLPSVADNQPVVQVRWAVWRGTEAGSSSAFSIDNISVNGTGGSTNPNIAGVSLAGGPNYAAGSTVSVTVSLTAAPAVGSPATVQVTSAAFASPITIVITNPNTSGSANASLPTVGSGFQAGANPVSNVNGFAISSFFDVFTNVPIVINELDSDTPGTDVAEFIELYDGGIGNTPLDGLVVVFYNGNGNVAYSASDLDGKSTNAAGYFVLGDAAITSALGGGFSAGNSLTIANGNLQNGDDAVALYGASNSTFPSGTTVTASFNILDALVYDTSDADNTTLINTLLNSGQPQMNEDGGGDGQHHSLQRCPNGAGGQRNTGTVTASFPTPGAANAYTNVPGNVSATPSTVCEGDNSILSASVGIDETVDWYTGGCGAVLVGSGGSISVNPASTTEYFARSRSLISGCMSAAGCASVIVTTTPPQTWYLDSDGDGFGDPNSSVLACNQPRGYVANSGDACPRDPNKTQPGQCGCGIADTDSDGDGAADCIDGCPRDPNKTAPGTCGCGVADTDTDGDGTPDCADGCPNDPAKVRPGACGCGVADTDTDGDGTPDCLDNCPRDPNKTNPGTCGCGIADTDSDGDGIPDCIDKCPGAPDNLDSDGDGTPDCLDGCPNDPHKTAPGACGCGVADTDTDGDGTPDCNDGCPNDPTKIRPGACGCGVAETDTDGDGTPDCTDGCPNDPAKTNPGICGCGVADTDSDGDGTPDCNDGCPNDPAKIVAGQCGCGVPETDTDGDGVPDCVDNCATVANVDQADCNKNGIGDACENAPDCNTNGVPDDCDIAGGTSLDANNNGIPDECEPPTCPADVNGDNVVNVADLLQVIIHWGACPSCPADVNHDGVVGVADLLAVISGWGPC